METKLVVILHADVVGSTALVQIDERVAHERIQDAFLRLSESISNYRGSTHEVRGDALVAEFDRGSDAISAALDFQAANRRHNRGLVGEIRPELRVGIAMGEVIIADNTLTGAGVVLAQRLEQLAADGGVVVQGAVYEATPRRLPFDYEFLGEQTLKGFDELVRAYSVGLKAGESIPVPESARQFDSRRAPGSPPLELPSKPSIAILPFENLSADPEQEYFSDGIAEDVITALSRFHDLFVIARNSSFVYRGRSVDVREVGRELGVQYVVEGSVRRSGPRGRLSVQLIEAATGNHIWAERFDRSLEDVFAVQDEVTERVAAAVGRSVNVFEGTRAVERRPQELGGWELLARAEWHVNRTSQDSLSRARALCLEAIERFPDYPSGYSLLARVYCLQSLYGVAEGSVDDAARVARQAIALDPNDERAHIYLARVLMVQGRHDEALLEAEAALSINPNYAHGIGFAGCIEAISGRSSYGRAVEHLDRAMRLSPQDPLLMIWYTYRGVAEFVCRNLEAAIEWFGRATRRNADFASAQRMLASSYAHIGDLERARDVLTEVERIEPGFTIQDNRQRKFKQSWKKPEDYEYMIEGLRLAGAKES